MTRTRRGRRRHFGVVTRKWTARPRVTNKKNTRCLRLVRVIRVAVFVICGAVFSKPSSEQGDCQPLCRKAPSPDPHPDQSPMMRRIIISLAAVVSFTANAQNVTQAAAKKNLSLKETIGRPTYNA